MTVITPVVAVCSGPDGDRAPSRGAARLPASGASLTATVGPALRVPVSRELLGRWRVLSFHGEPPPADALRGLRMTRHGDQTYASWDDGVNQHGLQWSVDAGGGFHSRQQYTTLVGCIGSPCGRPSGFGVDQAAGVRTTQAGQMVFLDGDGNPLAVYARR